MTDGLVYKLKGNVYISVDLVKGFEKCVEFKINENGTFIIVDIYKVK